MNQRISDALPAKQLASCGDVSCELLVNPIPRPEPDHISIALRPRTPRVTFLDHRKPNSTAILRHAQELLRERGIEVNEEILTKDDASVPMTAAQLSSLANEPGLVVCGVSD